MIASMLLLLVGSIMRCQQRPDASPKEVIEATEDTSRQVTGQDPAPEIKRIEPADSAETPDSAMQAHMERQCFETLTKMADGGKVYATDADGKRIPKAFTRFDDYRQFIVNNPQYPKNHYSYDVKGESFNIDFNGWQIQNKPQATEPIP